MSRYFFYLLGASEGANDSEGEEFASDAAALDHIVASVSAMMMDGLKAGADFSAFVFQVHDQLGQLIATVPFLNVPKVTGTMVQ